MNHPPGLDHGEAGVGHGAVVNLTARPSMANMEGRRVLATCYESLVRSSSK